MYKFFIIVASPLLLVCIVLKRSLIQSKFWWNKDTDKKISEYGLISRSFK